jgi:hypothetical protein
MPVRRFGRPSSNTAMGLATVLSMLWGLSCAAEDAADAWRELKGKHFIIYSQDDSVASRAVLHQAEAYYDSIVKKLGFKRLDNFWLWERRAKIKLYASHHAFIQAAKAPAWAVAKASVRSRTIEGFGSSALFLKSRLPHELAHLIFREYIGFTGTIPLWLDEGVAQWCEQGDHQASVRPMREWIPLQTLTSMSVRQNQDAHRVRLFYNESASLVQYLVESYGRDRFSKFCRQLRDGKTLDGALRFTYPKSISSMVALEQQWSAWQLARGVRRVAVGTGREKR